MEGINVVAVVLAHLWLRESLSASQRAGAALLAGALLLAVLDPGERLARRGRGWLHWLTPPGARVEATIEVMAQAGSSGGGTGEA